MEIGSKSATKTVKAFELDIALINEQARKLGCTAAEVIHQMCEELRKLKYLEELAESFDMINSNSEKSAEFKSEQAAWDCTLSDGLDNAS